MVSVCAGVSLPPSVVTNLIAPVVTGITGPRETTVIGIFNAPLLNLLLPPLALNATGLLAQAAAGQPITLQALASDGTVIGPSDQCRATADSITLNTPAGVAIGGNQITSLGANGAAAFASDIGGRGALTGYAATGLAGTQRSAGELSVGAPDALRQITNVASGSAANDAATVSQVDGVLGQVTPSIPASAPIPPRSPGWTPASSPVRRGWHRWRRSRSAMTRPIAGG